MSAPASPVSAPFFEPDTLLHDLMAVSLTAINLMRPCYGPGGELTDFAPEYFNPAAQRMTGLPERPAGTARTLYPDIFTNGIFAFYRQVFETGEPGNFELYYQADGLDNYFRIAARRSGERLLVSFTDTAEQPRTAAENALRESQVREQAALAEVERQRGELSRVFELAPVAIAVYEGPEHRIELANPVSCQLLNRSADELLGKPLFEALPELAGHGFEQVLASVYTTGQPVRVQEQPGTHARAGRLDTLYWNLAFMPMRAADGRITGALSVGIEVTEQLRARQQVEQLNQQLEARVQERTQQLTAALAKAEQQRQQREAQQGELQRIFEQAPVGIAVFRGPKHTIEMANELQLVIWGKTRAESLGKGLFELLPEVAGQGFEERLAGVLATGTPFVGTDVPATYTRHGGSPEQVYFSFVYTPLREADGHISGVVVVVHETTAQVLARQQVEQLNQELEARVQERTLAAQAAQAAAERERAQLQALIAQAPVAIGLFEGEELRVTSANAAISALWGYPPEQVVGRPLLEAIPELQGQGFDDLLRQVLHTQVPFIGTETPALLRRAGQLHTTYFNFVYQPLYATDGQVTGVLNVAADVTEQVLARQQVEQLNQELEARVQGRTREALALQADLLAAAQRQATERELFYQVFEQTPAAVALLRSPVHRFEYVNPTYQNLFVGRPLVGLDYATALPEAVAQGFATLLDRVYETGETFFGSELPFTPTPAPGQPPRTSYYSFTFQAYREAGQVAGISIFAFDVTEQVLAKQEREAQQRRLQAIFEQAPVAIFVLRGPTYILDVVNPFMSELLGQTPEELLGRPYFEAMPELATQGYAAFMDQVWHTGRPFTAREQPAKLRRHQAGEMGYFTFVYQPLFDGQGRPTDIMCVALDETEPVRARQQVQDLNQELAAINEELTATNEELNESNTRLTRTNVDLDTFVYTASHDLKAPITNIESIVLALRSTLPPAVQQDEVVAHLLGLLDTTVARFQFTIGQLTDISRLQLAHTGPAEPVLLAQIIENVRLDLVPAIAAAGTRLTVEVAPQLVISFSPSNLRSIVYNLLSNAIKYRAPDRPSQVLIRAEQTSSAVVLSVQDNGLGMSELQQRQLFGLFQRLHTHVEGTGVGLYISKRLVENAGGTIAVHSQANAGATFTVTFPI